MATLTFCTLGGFALQRAGTSLPDNVWPTHKSRQLIKLLLTARGQVISGDRIVEWLWPDLAPDRARNNLWVAVSQARRVLEPDLAPRTASAYLLNAEDGYRLCLDCEVTWDVTAFEEAAAAARRLNDPQARAAALEAACALYTGEFLPDDPYEAWTMPLRQSLQECYLALRFELAECYAALGRYADAAAQARALLAVEPADERAYQSLMRFTYFMGDQRAALQAYDECVRVLRAELDVAPMPETVELYRQIQRHTLPLPERVRPPAPPAESIYSLTHTPFVGRAHEYDLLVRAVQDAAQGQGRMVLIGGEPGIGKSRLVQEIIGYARGQGMTTLLAQCYQVEQAIPFQPIVDMLDQALLDTPAQTFLGLPPVYLAEMATLVPELGDLVGTLPPLPDDEGGMRQLRRFRALQQCLELLAGDHGLLLAMDDIHWADHATRQYLHYLATHIARLPVLLICTHRAEVAAGDMDMATFLDSAGRTPQAMRLVLERFSPDDTSILLDRLTGSATATGQLGAWLHAETDGNPFFLISILQSLVEQRLLHEDRPAWQVDGQRLDTSDVRLTLPEALRESVRVRLRRVPAAMRRVLEVAAVLGRRFDFATLEAVSRENGLALLDAIEGLCQRQLLQETGDGSSYDFSHDKVREVVYHDISLARRVLLHRSVAQTLEQYSGVHERSANLARHYELGQVWEKAINNLVLAADYAKDLFAVYEAAGFYDRALELAYAHPEVTGQALVLDLHRRRGEVRAFLAGRMQDAVADLELVLDAAQAAGDSAAQRESLIALGQVYRMADQLDRAMEYLNAALMICREGLDRRSLANVLHHVGTVAWSAGNNLQASIYHQEAADLSRGLDDHDLIAVQALHGRGEAFVAAARPAPAIELFEESLALARRIGNKRYEVENLQMIGWAYIGLMGTADYAKAQDVLNQSLVLSSEAHLDWNTGITIAFIGWVEACVGNYGQGLHKIQAAIDQLAAAGFVRFLSMAYDFLGYIYQDLNLHRQALEAHAEGLKIGIETNVGFWLPRLCADVAIDRLRLGELDAGHDLEVAFSLTIDDYQSFHAVRCLEGLMEHGILSGQFDRTLHFAALLEGISQGGGLREQQVHVRRWRGVAYRHMGKLAEAEQELQAALALAQSIGRVRSIWDVHSELAALYHVLGDTPRALLHEEQVELLVRQIAATLPDPELGAALPHFLALEH